MRGPQTSSFWGAWICQKKTNDKAVHEAGLLHLDISKAKTTLNWSPKMNSEQAIKLTIDWYKTLLNDKKTIKDFTKQQIDNYLNKI